MTRNEYRLPTSLDSFTLPAYRPENTSGSAGAGGAGAAGACAAGAPAGSVTDSAAGRFASNGLLGDGGAPFSAGASFSAGAVAAAAGAHAGAPRLKFPGTNSDTAAAATSAGLGLVGLGFAPFAGLGFGLLSNGTNSDAPGLKLNADAFGLRGILPTRPQGDAREGPTPPRTRLRQTRLQVPYSAHSLLS